MEKTFALDLSENPEKSVFFRLDMGTGIDFPSKDREAENLEKKVAERYTEAGFLFGLGVGFRFNETFGLEFGWHQSKHDGESQWGGDATYSLWHLAARLALATQSRQTLVFVAGPVIGGFYYGQEVDSYSNALFTFGGIGGATLEHEFGIFVTGTVSFYYLGAYRRPEKLYLYHYESNRTQSHLEDSLDFSGNEAVHSFWVCLGIQFEWLIR